MEQILADTAVEQEPEFLAEFAGAAVDKLRQFAADLTERGELLGLIGPQELPRLWTRHIVNSALLAPLLRENGSLADIGTGGGFPGIVLAAMRSDVRVRMIEPMERRCAWLQEQVTALGLENAEVLRGRAEEFHDAFTVDQVTARAVTALRKLVPLTAPLLEDGGEMLFLKGTGVQGEIENAKKALAKYKVWEYVVETLGSGLTEETRVFRGLLRR